MISTDFVCTYKLLSDEEESDELWRQQFLQVVGCSKKYDDVTISATMKESYQLILKSKYGEQFLNSIWENGLAPPLGAFITRETRDPNTEILLIQAYFGWATLDVFHRALVKLKQGNEIEWEEWQSIIDTYEKHKK